MFKAVRHLLHTIFGVTRARVAVAVGYAVTRPTRRGELGLTVLKTPVRAPQANGFCERVIGTIRRKCLDFMVPMSERHVRAILREWVRHYNRGRPDASLGPGIPERSVVAAAVVSASDGRSVPAGCQVAATPILSGLHHEYGLERYAA